MEDKDFIEKGYREFIPRGIDAKEYREKAFQKKFCDEVGEKYFITAYKYHFKKDYNIPDGYEFETQLYRNGNHAPLNINFFTDDWDIDTVERYVERIFSGCGFEHYERRE